MTSPPPPLVVLVHGFMRTGMSMMPMALGLRRRGFVPRTVTQWNVPTDIADLADGLYARVSKMRQVEERRLGYLPDVHFVTHSMGGIVTRAMFARHEISGPNRIVMLAPPNRGSRFAAHMRDNVLGFPWGGFDPLRKLLPDERGDCADAGDPDAEIGIIAGAPPRAFGFPWSMGGMGRIGFTPAAAGEHDGKVALDETRMDSAVDWVVVPKGHTFLMASPAVIDLTAAFLKSGRFEGPSDL